MYVVIGVAGIYGGNSYPALPTVAFFFQLMNFNIHEQDGQKQITTLTLGTPKSNENPTHAINENLNQQN